MDTVTPESVPTLAQPKVNHFPLWVLVPSTLFSVHRGQRICQNMARFGLQTGPFPPLRCTVETMWLAQKWTPTLFSICQSAHQMPPGHLSICQSLPEHLGLGQKQNTSLSWWGSHASRRKLTIENPKYTPHQTRGTPRGKPGQERRQEGSYLLRPAAEHPENAGCGPRTVLETNSCPTQSSGSLRPEDLHTRTFK